jgi:hypothetical protein
MCSLLLQMGADPRDIRGEKAASFPAVRQKLDELEYLADRPILPQLYDQSLKTAHQIPVDAARQAHIRPTLVSNEAVEASQSHHVMYIDPELTPGYENWKSTLGI